MLQKLRYEAELVLKLTFWSQLLYMSLPSPQKRSIPFCVIGGAETGDVTAWMVILEILPVFLIVAGVNKLARRSNPKMKVIPRETKDCDSSDDPYVVSQCSVIHDYKATPVKTISVLRVALLLSAARMAMI